MGVTELTLDQLVLLLATQTLEKRWLEELSVKLFGTILYKT